MQIRPAIESDAGGICEMHIRSIRELCIRDYTPEQIEVWAGPKRPSDYLEPIRGKRIFVAEQAGQIAGFGDYHATKNEICAIYVHPDFVRQGLGRALFLVVTDELKARGFSHVELDASLTSVGFYEAMGCRKIEERLHPFRDGVSIPCVRMIIDL
jgi:putative acetyltransferase